MTTAATTEPVREPMPPSTTMTTMNVEFRMPPLVKAKEEVERVALAQAYSTMGYKNATTVSRITCTAGTAAIPLRRVNPEEYLRLRNRLLPEGSAMLSESHLPFLETQAFFYGGTDFVLAATVEGNNLTGTELLGNPAVAPGILAALGIPHGEFLTPGGETDYAMFCCLDGQTPPPDYFGLAFE